jgi:hypothetical protein
MRPAYCLKSKPEVHYIRVVFKKLLHLSLEYPLNLHWIIDTFGMQREENVKNWRNNWLFLSLGLLYLIAGNSYLMVNLHNRVETGVNWFA